MKSLKVILVQIVLIFGLLIGKQEIVLGQSTIQDSTDCICYTDNQDKRATECLKHALSRDSLLTNALIRLNGFKELSSKNDSIIFENNKRLLKVTKERNIAYSKLKMSVRLTKIGLPVSFGFGFIVAYMIIK